MLSEFPRGEHHTDISEIDWITLDNDMGDGEWKVRAWHYGRNNGASPFGGWDRDFDMVYNVDNITRSWEADVNDNDSPYSDNNVLGGMTYEDFITFAGQGISPTIRREGNKSRHYETGDFWWVQLNWQDEPMLYTCVAPTPSGWVRANAPTEDLSWGVFGVHFSSAGRGKTSPRASQNYIYSEIFLEQFTKIFKDILGWRGDLAIGPTNARAVQFRIKAVATEAWSKRYDTVHQEQVENLAGEEVTRQWCVYR